MEYFESDKNFKLDKKSLETPTCSLLYSKYGSLSLISRKKETYMIIFSSDKNIFFIPMEKMSDHKAFIFF